MYNSLKNNSINIPLSKSDNRLNLLSNEYILDLSNYTDLNYFTILIPNTIDFYTILGNPSLALNISIISELGRTTALTLTIKNLLINQSENSPIIAIANDSLDNKLFFEGNNILINSSISESTNNSAIFIPSATQLFISGSPDFTNNILDVFGGVYGSGIGSGNSTNAGNIIIGGIYSTIIATGGDGAAGIGGGLSGNGGNITICDYANVTANGGYYGCGIGGGFGYNTPEDSGNITISNFSNVKAFGGVGGCGIGGGSCFYSSGGNATNIIIKDNATVYADGDYCGSGIGGGFGLAGTGGSLINLTISNYATVYSYGGGLSTGIGGGFGGNGGHIENISISDFSKVYAYGGETGGAIAGGTSGNLAGLGGGSGRITISDNSLVVTTAGKDSSGIGGGAGDIGGDGGIITVKDFAQININTFLGYYKNNPNSTLNICGGSIYSKTLYLSHINLCGGVVFVNDKNFAPELEPNNFLSIKLIYPNGIHYTSPLYLKRTSNSSYSYYVTPDENGKLSFYASDDTYYFETVPSPKIYKTKTFTAPTQSTEEIILIVPIYKLTRGINLFGYR